MSRIGKHPISIPAGVTVSVKDGVVTVKGPKGELTQSVDARIDVAVEDAQVASVVVAMIARSAHCTALIVPHQQHDRRCLRRFHQDA